MAQITRITTFVDGDVLTAAQLNNEFDNVVDAVNSLDDDNIADGANISPAKISATIAGDGIARDGSTGALSANVDGITLEVSSNQIRVKDSGISTAKIAASAVTTAKINDGAVTRAKLAAIGQQQSGFVTDTETGSSLADIAGLSVSITTTGKPIMIALKGLSTNASQVRAEAPNGTTADCTLAFLRDSTVVSQYQFGATITDSSSNIEVDVFGLPASSFWTIDTPSAGTYTYKVQGKNNGTGAASEIDVRAELIVWELG